jgi:hypothetical protein
MKHSCFPQFLVLFLVGVMFTACAPITLIRANVEVEFTRTNVAKLGIVAVPVQVRNFLNVIRPDQRDRMDIRAKNTMQSLFGETARGRDETLEAVKAQNLDGDLLAALNQYDLQGTLRREVFDAVLDAIDARYMVLMRMQYAGSSVGGWFIFTSLDSSATFNLIVYDRVNGRVVTDVLTNGYASRGLFGGGLIDAAVDQAFDNALSALKARVK